MKYNNDFRHDLEVGQMKELALGVILTGSKIEVKSDAIAKKTGNVFVEYQSRGKKSGIATSEADYYAFEIDNTYILISTEKLSKACRKYIGTNRDVLGGDSNTSKGILLPVIELV